MNCRTFQKNPSMRGKSNHHHVCKCACVSMCARVFILCYRTCPKIYMQMHVSVAKLSKPTTTHKAKRYFMYS